MQGLTESKNQSCFEQLEFFLKTPGRSQWLSDEGLSVYVRQSKRLFPGRTANQFESCLDIASVSAVKEGSGAFTRFLQAVEDSSVELVFVENVLSERFADFFRKQGYSEYNVHGLLTGAPPSFFKRLK